jgi:hypothetical protein
MGNKFERHNTQFAKNDRYENMVPASVSKLLNEYTRTPFQIFSLFKKTLNLPRLQYSFVLTKQEFISIFNDMFKVPEGHDEFLYELFRIFSVKEYQSAFGKKKRTINVLDVFVTCIMLCTFGESSENNLE